MRSKAVRSFRMSSVASEFSQFWAMDFERKAKAFSRGCWIKMFTLKVCSISLMVLSFRKVLADSDNFLYVCWKSFKPCSDKKCA